jgi:tetratricopeptide (TPR) repeat protein
MNVDRYRATANTLVRNPDDPVALVDLFALHEKGDHEHHYWLARRAYLADVTYNTVFNYGSACHRVGKFKEALRLYKECLELAPDDDCRGVALHHLGIAHRALGNNQDAEAFYRQAYALTGDAAIGRDMALSILAQGDLQRGFEAFEIRKDAAAAKYEKDGGKSAVQATLPASVVQWQGEDLAGESITVYHEEGNGDFFMLSRFIPRLRELGASKIYLTGQVPKALDLVAANIAIDGIFPLAGPIESDFVVGSATVPWRVGISYATISGKPYFKAEPAKIPLRGELNVGLVWQGNPNYGQDANRSMAFSNFCPLFDLVGVAYYSLQCGMSSLDPDKLGMAGFVANLEPLCKSWLDTAKMIQALDLVVAVDTAVAHLAGCLGKEVCLLTPHASDWRWPRSGEKTPWYNSMRVIRQERQGEWAPSILKVKRLIERKLHELRRQAA